MSEELGRIEKPSAEKLKGGRKLYFVPLIYGGAEAPAELLEKCHRYWNEVENQVGDLERKLGQVSRIYHELITAGGEDGLKIIKELNDKSYAVVRSRLEKGACLEATEEVELLTEFMDWGRCLAMGLQNQRVFTVAYQSYTDAGKKRNEHIARHIDETLPAEETGILFMREGHQVQFPADIQVFYVAPPALDEINRWLRERPAQPPAEDDSGTETPEGKQ